MVRTRFGGFFDEEFYQIGKKATNAQSFDLDCMLIELRIQADTLLSSEMQSLETQFCCLLSDYLV